MLTVNGAQYKDANANDFDHYFKGTVMALKLSPHKRRLFICSGLNGDKINGQYLNRDKLFKDRKIPWKDWWENLDAIVMQPLIFNIGNGVGVWKHQLAKNLRKSFPWQQNCLKYYGEVDALSRTAQNLCHVAFSELYGEQKENPPLLKAWKQEKSLAVYTREGFLLDRGQGNVYYRTALIGKMDAEGISLPVKREAFKTLLFKAGFMNVKIVENPQIEKPKKEIKLMIDMGDHFVNGYHIDPWGGKPWFCVVCTNPALPSYGESRTYQGYYEAPYQLMAGWKIHNCGNQVL